MIWDFTYLPLKVKTLPELVSYLIDKERILFIIDTYLDNVPILNGVSKKMFSCIPIQYQCAWSFININIRITIFHQTINYIVITKLGLR